MADLDISPSELKFRFELRKNIPVTLSLHNPGSERLAFKVKTTSPKKYCVRPSSGYVEPGATKDVQVIMQAQREYPPTGLADCKDKFLVQSVKVGKDAPVEVSADLFDTSKSPEGSVKQTKLRVLLLGPPKPPSPVPEGVEEEGSTPGRTAFKDNGPPVDSKPAAPATQPVQAEKAGPAAAAVGAAGGADTGAALSRERAKHRDALAKAEADKADLAKRLSQLELQTDGRPGAAAGGMMSGGFTLIHLIVIALVAFLIGYFLR